MVNGNLSLLQEAVSVAIAGAVGLVRALGVGPCDTYLEKLIANITKVANGEALCQLAEEDEEEMEEEEEQKVSCPLSPFCQMEECLGPYRHTRLAQNEEGSAACRTTWMS